MQHKLPLDTADLNGNNNTTEVIPFDIKGSTRVLNFLVDVGAYEFSTSVMNEQVQIYVNANATGANDGSSWSDAYTDLQPALDVAAENAEIRVAAGTYKPTAAPDDSTGDDRHKAFHFNRRPSSKRKLQSGNQYTRLCQPKYLKWRFKR